MINSEKPITFNFELRLGEPIVYQINKLDEFYDTMKTVIEWHGKLYKLITNQFINDFVRDKAGNIKNIDKMFAEWDKYLFVCACKKENKENIDIYNNLKNTSFGEKTNTATNADKENADRIINDCLAHAKKFICATERGTFPRTDDLA
jgi:hypothetical protein